MKEFDFEYQYALQHPYNLYEGAIIRKRSCKEKPTKDSKIITTWYRVKIRHDARIFEQIDESEVPNVDNIDGDYVVNLRTGAVSVYMDGKVIAVPVSGIENKRDLLVVQKWAGITE